MRDTKSNPEVGLAFCDNRFHLAIVPERGIIRHYDGIVVSEKRMHDTIKEILKHKINFTPSRIAVSHHDPSVRSMIAETFHVLAVPPTIATLEGLAVSPSSARSVLRRGNGGSGATGLLKIGPKKVSWAKYGDLEPRFIDIDVIAGFSPLAADFSNFVGSHSKNPVELLGNWGWVQAAHFFEETEPDLIPDPRTVKFLEMDMNVRQNRRDFVSHLGWMTFHGDPFATKVSSFMTSQIGRTIGHVAKKETFGTLYLQCNAISAVRPMIDWVKGTEGHKIFAEAVTKYDSSGLSNVPNIVLMEPRPQVPEALGAVMLASRLVGAER